MPRDPRDYKLDLSATPAEAPVTPAPAGKPGGGAGARPFLGVHFACCNIYLRLYRATAASQYTGRCPRCGKSVKFPIARGGTDARAFRLE